MCIKRNRHMHTHKHMHRSMPMGRLGGRPSTLGISLWRGKDLDVSKRQEARRHWTPTGTWHAWHCVKVSIVWFSLSLKKNLSSPFSHLCSDLYRKDLDPKLCIDFDCWCVPTPFLGCLTLAIYLAPCDFALDDSTVDLSFFLIPALSFCVGIFCLFLAWLTWHILQHLAGELYHKTAWRLCSRLLHCFN